MPGYYNELTQTENKECLLLLNMRGGVELRASDSQLGLSGFNSPCCRFDTCGIMFIHVASVLSYVFTSACLCIVEDIYFELVFFQ